MSSGVPEEDVVRESELEKGFVDKLASIDSSASKIRECIQCGLCSATCPLSNYMDHTPREIINLTRGGFKNEVLSSNTPWLCASCYSCLVDCPQKIEISEVMYVLKRLSAEEGYTPGIDSPTPSLLNAFVSEVRRNGRVSEPHFLLGFKLRRQGFALEKLMPIGLSLLRNGRLNFEIESIESTEDIKKIFDSLEDKS
ncbi:hypothetical protein AKJ61_03335 [candidate division MSBL1 archaeon SCGC-AAA259B11]|uniref:4Fe-4S ferredoxin-type domain-containing protein n=1 Tax=candidate division MSBL1 archaeon SCGC-AAA259B11 TaxID=1698260 RepID=A0A133U4U8_9EURY|nr:hypothetical protein AKJ61_03335 [candidate division MSBL1 archaeon SCGC-AAA259B11]